VKRSWRQVGSTGRAHLFAWLPSPTRDVLAGMSECGVVRPPLAHMPVNKATRCGLCRRLVELAEKRGQPMEVVP
jgi:spermidine synthase